MIRKNRFYQRGTVILKATAVLLTASILVSMAQLSACAATTWTFWGDEEEISEDGSDTDTVCVATVYKGQTEQFLDLEAVDGEITWSVDRPEILNIGTDGELIPLKVGNAMVTAIVKTEPQQGIEAEQTQEASVFTGSSILNQDSEEEQNVQNEQNQQNEQNVQNKDNENNKDLESLEGSKDSEGLGDLQDPEELEELEEDPETIYQYYVSVCKKKAYKAVKKAQSALGATYSQAKRMKKGYYDCSSLVWRSYSPYNITFGDDNWAPTAADQGLWCEENGKVLAAAAEDLSAGKLLPGDLIYYTKNVNNGRYKNIYHVAMFEGYEMELDEETGETILSGTMIEASGTSVVRNPYRTGGSSSSRIALIGRPTK